MKVWVGGATGFLGSELVCQLVADGHDVRGASRKGGEVAGVVVDPVDVLDEDAVVESARGAEGAFLATGKVSRDPGDAEELHRLHVLGTRRALAGLRKAGVKRVVCASTSGTIAVGTDPDAVHDETHPAPLDVIARWPYYRSKYYGELEAIEANDPPDFEVLIVNPSLLLGPGDERESSTGDIRRFLERSIPATPGGGLSFVDVRDAAAAMIAAFERGRPGERYLLGGCNLTVAALFSRLERISGVKAPRLKLPKSKSLALAASGLFTRAVEALGGQPPVDEASVEMGQHYWYCDSTKAERELDFRPRDPGETLGDTVRDLIDRGAAYPRAGVEASRPSLVDEARRRLS